MTSSCPLQAEDAIKGRLVDPKGPKSVDPMGKQRAARIDKLSRKLFPIAFLIFNFMYWLYYTVPALSGK